MNWIYVADKKPKPYEWVKLMLSNGRITTAYWSGFKWVGRDFCGGFMRGEKCQPWKYVEIK